MRLRNAQGTVAWRSNDLPAARTHYEAALGMAREMGDRRRAAGSLTNLGLLAQEENDLVSSRQRHEEAMAIYADLGDKAGLACVQLNLGVVCKLEHRLEEAAHLIAQCLSAFDGMGDNERLAAALRNLGEVAYYDGRRDEAGGLVRRSLSITGKLGDRRSTARGILWLGIIEAARGQYEVSARLLGCAEAARESLSISIDASDRLTYQQSLAAVRTHLEPRRFEAAWRAGRGLSIEHAAMGSRERDGELGNGSSEGFFRRSTRR
jgi:tetratricopeptide (TPR) repeat protein